MEEERGDRPPQNPADKPDAKPAGPKPDDHLLFADDNDTEPMLYDGKSGQKAIQWLRATNGAIGHTLNMDAVIKRINLGTPPVFAE